MNKLWLITIPILLTGFCLGVYYGQQTLEPKVITQSITQLEIEYIEIERIVEHVVKVPVEVIVVKEVPRKLVYFSSLEELEAWLASDTVDSLIPSYPEFDCDDYAYKLQRRALKDGYTISTEDVVKRNFPHMLNSALIGNEIYYIEPSNDKVWFHNRRD